jgi:hypothetical protein
MSVTNPSSPHENEYLAAIAGLGEQTQSPAAKPTYAVGDFVSGCTAGKRWQGRIEWTDGERLTLDVGGGWLAVSARDVTH